MTKYPECVTKLFTDQVSRSSDQIPDQKDPKLSLDEEDSMSFIKPKKDKTKKDGKKRLEISAPTNFIRVEGMSLNHATGTT